MLVTIFYLLTSNERIFFLKDNSASYLLIQSVSNNRFGSSTLIISNVIGILAFTIASRTSFTTPFTVFLCWSTAIIWLPSANFIANWSLLTIGYITMKTLVPV